MDGTDSNQLFIEASANSHDELILTPRQGGPTPPNPNAPSFDDEAQSRMSAGNGSSDQQAAVVPPELPAAAQHGDDSSAETTHANPVENSESPRMQETPAAEPRSVIGQQTLQEAAQQLQQLPPAQSSAESQ